MLTNESNSITLRTRVSGIIFIPYLFRGEKLPNRPGQDKFRCNNHPKHQPQPIPASLPWIRRRHVGVHRCPSAYNYRGDTAPDDAEQGSLC